MTRPASVFAAIVTLALVPSTDAFAQITQFDLEAGTGSFIPFAPTRLRCFGPPRLRALTGIGAHHEPGK